MLRETERGNRMRLLAVRESSGILVRLFWDENSHFDSDVVVEYED